VNLILFAPAELAQPLPRTDRRAAHILDVLRRGPGDTFDAGVINGPRGKATLVAVQNDALTLQFSWSPPPPALEPLTLLIGLPRPQTARDILRDATTLGAAALHFVRTERAEPSYAQSTLWTSGEWQRHLIAGAEQAFDTRIPEVTWGRGLAEALPTLPAATCRIALDNYASTLSLSAAPLTHDVHPVLAIGSERGWTTRERELLREHGFVLAHLGSRVLRTETAVIATLAIVRSRLQRM
jgi:16S rRNA (uracil1498-N3)-methyltransferase